MKKVLSLSLAALALIAFAGTSASACGGSASCGAKASKTSSTSASSKTCSQQDMEACAKKMGVSVEECMKMCSEKGSMTMHSISIQGMTCTKCEASVTGAIEALPGVNKVVSISYQDGNAVVCVDKNRTSTANLTQAIADKGFKAEIIPAVAKTASADGKQACSKSCSAAQKAACTAKNASKDAKDTK